MKKILIILCGILSISATIFAQTPAESRPGREETTLIKTGMQAPEFTAHMLDGTTIKSAALKNKVVLLNFWATWCPPCRKEFTRVQADIVERFAGRDFAFIALSSEEARETVKTFMDINNYTFPVGLDSDRTVYAKFASNYIPRNFVIDKQGKVVMTTVGYDPEEFDKMIALIEDVLQ